MDAASIAALASVQPVRAYDKGSLEQFIIAAEHERERLQAALVRANTRRAVAERRVADAHRARGQHAEMVEETQRSIAELKRDNEQAVAAILAAADAEVEALLALARAQQTVLAHPSSHRGPSIDEPGARPGLTVLPAI